MEAGGALLALQQAPLGAVSAPRGAQEQEVQDERSARLSIHRVVVLPLCSVTWPRTLVTQLLRGVPVDNINSARLGALLQTLPPPYHIIRYCGDAAAAFHAANTAFQRLRTHTIHAKAPLDVAGCGNRWVAKASVSAARRGARDVECHVISHLVQVKTAPGVAGSNNLSNFFMEDLRLAAHVLHTAGPPGMSPNVYWTTHGHQLVTAAIQFVRASASPHPVRTTPPLLRLRHLNKAFFKAVGACTVFRPMVARHMYQGATRVLDMCGGWGDRLLAILSTPSVQRAVVVDPEPALHARYAAMRAAFRPPHADPGFHLATLVAPFEDLPLPARDPQHPVNANGPYCVAFTSPPFFNRETYATSHAQSLARYPAMRAWIDHFLVPMARAACARLRPGGLLALAMCDFRDTKAPHKGQFTADVVAAMQRGEPQVEFRGVILFSLLTEAAETRHRPQPIFVWQRRANDDRGAVHPVFQHAATRHPSARHATNSLPKSGEPITVAVPTMPSSTPTTSTTARPQRQFSNARPRKRARAVPHAPVVEM